ncbi:MAG: enoyl-CoA hydratase/isomerase family protein [Limnochordaceae bacterium]|nr:enoyl-CoA hydratase/isomerase family protein [Limnochordaceae bacterium]
MESRDDAAKTVPEEAGEGLVRYEPREGYALITLNRPDKYNALSYALLSALAVALDRAEQEPAVRAIVLAGAGKHFCAGADITEMEGIDGAAAAQAWIRRRAPLFERVSACEKPVVAAIQGAAMGGGLEIAMQADIRIAEESASFGQPEIRLGIMPGAGGTQRLARLVGLGRALEWLMTGARMDAREAWRVGLVNRVVPDGQVLAEAEKLAGELARQAPVALRLIKEVTRRGLEGPLSWGLVWERQAFAMTLATEDRAEGVRAFLEKRPPSFRGR